MFRPRETIIGLMTGVSWLNSEKQRTYTVWSRSKSKIQADWEEYRMARCHILHVYVKAERVFDERSKELLTYTPNPRKWCSTMKTGFFAASSSLPHLPNNGGKLVLSADEKASLFSAHFAAKQCRNSFQQLQSCAPSSGTVFYWLSVYPYS